MPLLKPREPCGECVRQAELSNEKPIFNMGYFTLDFKKAKGASDARMSDHIERRVIAPNVDPTRTHLNRELVGLPEGVTVRDEAIAHRIKSAGIKRKITPDQVRAVRVMMSGTHEDMMKIQESGRIDEWCNEEGVNVHLTIDREQEGWDGHVGFVPNYVKELGFDTNKTAIICGPPIMIKFTLAGLQELGFNKTQVFTTMELKMKCGVGKCGRCNIGSKYVCKDGPVFRCDQLDEMPNEY